jgi:Questin oxidase-like
MCFLSTCSRVMSAPTICSVVSLPVCPCHHQSHVNHVGILHPFIHLGFGVEFEQPAIMAEGLAQAAIHEDYLSPLWFEIEEAGKNYTGPQKPLVQIIDEIHNDKRVSASIVKDDKDRAVRTTDDNKIRDGLMARARQDIINHVIQYSVSEADMKRQHAEILNAV